MALEREKPLTDVQSLAATSSMKGSNSACKHRERIAQLSTAKKRSLQMANHCIKVADEPKVGFQVAGCANHMVFNNYYTIEKIRLSKVFTCKKHLLCPFCARLRGAKQVAAYLPKYLQIIKEKPSLVPALITLTAKNGFDLKERANHLINSFRKMQSYRRDWLKKGRGFNELCKLDGAVFSYETTYNEDSGWHFHLHAVGLLNDYIDVKKLSAEWLAITGDSFIVDVRKIQGDSEQEMAEAFCEVFKYALKFSDLSLALNLKAYKKLKGMKLQGSFGSFRGVKVPETMTDDLYEGLPYLELFYNYDRTKMSFNLDATKERTGEEKGEFPDEEWEADTDALIRAFEVKEMKKSIHARQRARTKKLTKSLAKHLPRKYNPD